MGGEPVSVSDVAEVRARLIAAASERQAMSYSGLIADLGHRFSRPLMRALCKTLDRIDELALAADEPELAVLVVRESDALPGQGWWLSGRASLRDYAGAIEGAEARDFVRALQARAFERWGPTEI